MKKNVRKIALHKETLQFLDRAVGGAGESEQTWCRTVCGTCPTQCYPMFC